MPPSRHSVGEILADRALAEVQLLVLQQTNGPHHLRNVEQRIAAVHRRLDLLEADLRRRATEYGVDPALPIAAICAELSKRIEPPTL